MCGIKRHRDGSCNVHACPDVQVAMEGLDHSRQHIRSSRVFQRHKAKLLKLIVRVAQFIVTISTYIQYGAKTLSMHHKFHGQTVRFEKNWLTEASWYLTGIGR
jgi:hypothetical protein